LTQTAKSVLEQVINKLVDENSQKFVDFFNNSKPLSTRMHQIELLPGLGKKHMWEVIEERQFEKFKSFDDIKERVKQLVKAILNLKRSIKGREEDLSPKLLVIGIYKNEPYKTYKDKITLIDEYIEEEYDEIIEKEEDGKKIVKVKHKVTKSKKPLFKVIGGFEENEAKVLNENDIMKLIDELFNHNQENISKVKVYKDPMIEVKVESPQENKG
jgi:hypothetical protein